MAYDWERLERLNGGVAVYRTEPHLDRDDEVWFWDAKYNVQISSEGKLVKRERVTPPPGLPTARHTLYVVDKQLFVDIEIYASRAVLRRGLLNGDLVATSIPATDVDRVLARYRALGFRDGSAWNATPQRVTVREYRKGGKWTVHVDGNVVVEDWRHETKRANRTAAITLAEQRIAAQRKAGYALRLIELTKASYANPKPLAVRGASKRAAIAKRPVFATPNNAYAAVDTAIAMLRDLHERLPTHHFVAELVDAKADRARIEASEGHAKYFVSMHRKRLGRWRSVKPGAPRRGESSWQYFVRTYGSVTWILGTEADADLEMFYCGNVSGGGWSCLEIGEHLYDMDGLIAATGQRELAALHVFAGGWHDDKSFAFDTRTSSPTGEHPIVAFGEAEARLAKPGAKPVAFGVWLHARVSKLAKIIERNLRELA